MKSLMTYLLNKRKMVLYGVEPKSGKWTVQNKAKRSVLVDTYKTFQNKDKINVQWGATHRLSIKAQLQYKFILCVEGNDIATNLAWALLSNSIVIAPPFYWDDWYMPSKLVPWVHFVPIKTDFSDLETQLDHCLANPELCHKINLTSKLFALQFCDIDKERNIALNVCKNYFNINSE